MKATGKGVSAMPERLLSTEMLVLIGLVAITILVPLLAAAIMRLQEFKRELNYLNNEIGRTTGAEQAHYIRRKRRLLLSLIPFVKY